MRRQEDLRSRRCGLTLIEMIVVIAVIGLLVSLVANGVMSARETARRMQCSSHLKQIGLAVHEYHSMHNVLPCSGVLGLRYLSMLLDGRPGNWNVAGTPDPCMLGPCPEAGEWARPRVYLCPSDPIVHRTKRSVSYVFSAGTVRLPGGRSGVSDGVGYGDSDPASVISLRDVLDGTSNTACASEQLISLISAAVSDDEIRNAINGSLAESNPLRHIWILSATFNLPRELPQLFQACDVVLVDVTPHLAGNPFNFRNSAYDHVRTPNARACSTTTSGPSSLTGSITPPTSLHRGGVNLLLCDGSVRFVSNSIDLRVWQAIGTRNGSEVVSEY